MQDDKTRGTAIELPFAPKEAFGKARVRVCVTVNGHSFRTTTFTIGGRYFVPLNKANRTAANVEGGDTIARSPCHFRRPQPSERRTFDARDVDG